MFRLPSPSFAVSMLALLVALGGAGYSATGGNFILGQTNSATNQTKLVTPLAGAAFRVDNTSTAAAATAMTLVVTSGRPPFATNSAVKVTNLNADHLDGLSSAAFVPAAINGWHYIGDPGEPAFENGWVNFEPNLNHNAADIQNAAYRIDNNHVVHIAGRVRDGTSQTIFTLPGAFCPHFSKVLPADSSGAHALITVSRGPTPCLVRVFAAANTNVSLDGISYPDDSSDILLAAGP